MRALLCFLLILFPSDEAQDLISAFQALPPGRFDEKIEILDRLHALKSDEGGRYITRVMDSTREDRVRSHAFLLWTQEKSPEAVIEYLDANKKRSGFEALLSVIPCLTGLDTLAYLKSIYDDPTLTRFRKTTGRAIATLETEEAFEYLKEKWDECTVFRKAFDLLPSLLSMGASRNEKFLLGLMQSRFAFARAEGAKKLMRLEGEFLLDKVGDFLAGETHPVVRLEVLRALAGMRTPEAAKEILDASSSHSMSARYELVELLASMPPDVVEEAIPAHWYAAADSLRFQVSALAFVSSPELSRTVVDGQLKILKKLTRDDRPDVRITAAVALGRLLGSDGKIRSVMGGGSVDDQWEMLQTLQDFRLDDAVIRKKLLSLLTSQRLEIRIKAAEALSTLGVREAVPQLEKMLASKSQYLRIAGIKALGRLGLKEGVPPLLRRLKKEKGRTAWEIARSLKMITGHDFAVDAGKWKDWWEKIEEEFTPPSVWEGLWKAEGESRYGFYGLSIDSHNIMFVLDVSGSMDDDGRIKALREELTRAIKGLTGEHFINMIFFNGRVMRWQDGLVPLDDKKKGYRQNALTRARYLYAEGATNLYGALKTALKDDEVDAVVLLSDGDPTVGEIINKRAILEAILKQNRIMQATIHVVAIGSADRIFLRKLAERTGGTFASR